MVDAEKELARQKLVWATGFCCVFLVVEFVGGYMARSLAVMTDAAHLMSDVAGFLISIFAIYLSSQKATSSMSFGFHRAEILGAVLSVLLIWALTGMLLFEAYNRTVDWFAGTAGPVDGKVMSIIAAIGVCVNIMLMLILGHGHSHGGHGHSHGGGHGHSHGGAGSKSNKAKGSHGHAHTEASPLLVGANSSHSHSHGNGEEHSHGHGHGGGDKHSYTDLEGGEHAHSHGREGVAGDVEENINVRAAYIHAIGDLLQSVGVFFAGILIWYRPEWQIADPICTFLFSIVVLSTTLGILKDSVRVLMEGTPSGIDYIELKADLLRIQGVTDVHDLHIWSITMGKAAMSCHILAADAPSALQDAQRVCAGHGITHTTIQVQDHACENNGNAQKPCEHPCVTQSCETDRCA